MEFLKVLRKGIIQALLMSISIYQHTLSPDHGPLKYVYGGRVCRFHPTCSQYTADSIKEYGLVGVWMGLKRVLSCNPFSKAL